MTDKPKFTSYSRIRFVKNIVIKALIVFFLIIITNRLIIDFNWNIFSVGLFLVFVFIISDPKELKIYSDKIRIQKNFLFGLFQSNTDFNIQNIKDIKVNGYFTKQSDLAEDVLGFVLPIYDGHNKIEIVTNDNKTHTFRLKVYKEILIEAIGLVESTNT